MQEKLPVQKPADVLRVLESLLHTNGGFTPGDVVQMLTPRVRKVDVVGVFRAVGQYLREHPVELGQHNHGANVVLSEYNQLYLSKTHAAKADEFLRKHTQPRRLVPRSENIAVPVNPHSTASTTKRETFEVPLLVDAERLGLDRLAGLYPLDTWVVSHMERRKQRVMLFDGAVPDWKVRHHYAFEYEFDHHDIRPVRLKNIHLLDRVLSKKNPRNRCAKD